MTVGKTKLTKTQRATMQRLAEGKLLYVPAHGVSYSTARSLVKRGLAFEVSLSEHGDSAGAWGIKITGAGRLAIGARCDDSHCELRFGHPGAHEFKIRVSGAFADLFGYRR